MRAGIFASAYHPGGGGITATFQAAPIDATDLSSYSFASQPIGTASGTRRVVVAVSARNASRSVSTLTIGGVSAAQDAVSAAATAFCEIWSAVVTTGTTATIAVTISGGTVGGMGLGIWSLTGGSATGNNSASNVNSATLTQSVTTTAGDVVIGVCSFRASSTGPKCAWNSGG